MVVDESKHDSQRPVSRKSRKLFEPEKLFVNLRPAYSVKVVFSNVAKGWKIKITGKFRASRRLRLENIKKITRNVPQNFRDFRETGPTVLRITYINELMNQLITRYCKQTHQLSLLV